MLAEFFFAFFIDWDEVSRLVNKDYIKYLNDHSQTLKRYYYN